MYRGVSTEGRSTIIVLDAEQRIRAIDVRGEALAKVVDELLDELDAR